MYFTGTVLYSHVHTCICVSVVPIIKCPCFVDVHMYECVCVCVVTYRIPLCVRVCVCMCEVVTYDNTPHSCTHVYVCMCEVVTYDNTPHSYVHMCACVCVCIVCMYTCVYRFEVRGMESYKDREMSVLLLSQEHNDNENIYYPVDLPIDSAMLTHRNSQPFQQVIYCAML